MFMTCSVTKKKKVVYYSIYAWSISFKSWYRLTLSWNTNIEKCLFSWTKLKKTHFLFHCRNTEEKQYNWISWLYREYEKFLLIVFDNLLSNVAHMNKYKMQQYRIQQKRVSNNNDFRLCLEVVANSRKIFSCPPHVLQ